MCSGDIFLGLLAILFPPLPVWIKCGICGVDSLINILLCVLGYLPGLLHSWYIIAKFPEPDYDYDALPADQEGGRVTYVYVQSPNGRTTRPLPQPPNAAMNYGTQNQSQSQQQHGVTAAGESSSGNTHAVPPSYAEVVAGDHKIQTRD
ncbi:hypothetical protein G6O67_006208 [Ophiocordyceps sinensis]|uniref:Stress response RCI peptide n=2 Tax=Ophiocordyceps sinensis TaxID=72228 RepID=A0A8H4LUZ8_9HYPO|nr:stress response RCI peptide [Ophiocordyceps sinensis CO18]KAF4506089.1 hypothetical protein G6O67_006208 [Ophiocordyceps sinensis]